jgi:hypothetical protein
MLTYHCEASNYPRLFVEIDFYPLYPEDTLYVLNSRL